MGRGPAGVPVTRPVSSGSSHTSSVTTNRLMTCQPCPGQTHVTCMRLSVCPGATVHLSCRPDPGPGPRAGRVRTRAGVLHRGWAAAPGPRPRSLPRASVCLPQGTVTAGCRGSAHSVLTATLCTVCRNSRGRSERRTRGGRPAQRLPPRGVRGGGRASADTASLPGGHSFEPVLEQCHGPILTAPYGVLSLLPTPCAPRLLVSRPRSPHRSLRC